MFDQLSDRLRDVLGRLSGRGRVSEADVDAALREVRLALLEADVNYRVVKDFMGRVRGRAVGAEVLESLNAGQQVIKIVNEELTAILGAGDRTFRLAGSPAVVLLVGLQGSGKTTSAAKLARHLVKQGRRPLLVAADPYRPAAVDQLQTLGRSLDVPVHAAASGTPVLEICREGVRHARNSGRDVVIVDTAGRLTLDEALMAEIHQLAEHLQPVETLLVVDAMIGQESVAIAQAFAGAVPLTGLILTKIDGDARGGAALSISSVSGLPVKFLGTSERTDGLEPFHPDRLAGRILQQGDILSLVEKAQGAVDEKEAERLAKKVTSKKGMDLEDFLNAMRQMQKMGPLKNVLGLLPGMNPAMLQAAKIDDKKLKHVEAIVLSMTPRERGNPDLINGQRRLRIARGSGRTVQEVNTLLAQFKQMQKVMKSVGKSGGMGMKLPFGRGPFPG